MKRAKAEAARWLAQAESDLGFAELGLREGFFAQACFVCQQAVEKALKALHYLGGARVVLGHSLVELQGRRRRATAPGMATDSAHDTTSRRHERASPSVVIKIGHRGDVYRARWFAPTCDALEGRRRWQGTFPRWRIVRGPR